MAKTERGELSMVLTALVLPDPTCRRDTCSCLQTPPGGIHPRHWVPAPHGDGHTRFTTSPYSALVTRLER